MFQGREGFEWFTGIIEDRNDPLFLNRVRVRIFGIHTYDKQQIATPDLPWAEVMMPTTTASLSGLGTTVHGLVEGSFVVGFFRDGMSNQEPVVMGSFIGAPQAYSRMDETYGDNRTGRKTGYIERKHTEGFNDPRLTTAADYNKAPTSKSADRDREGSLLEQGVAAVKELIVGPPEPTLNLESGPDGNAPKHINRNYGLTLALDDSPRRDGDKRGVQYPKADYYPTSEHDVESSVNKLGRSWGIYDTDIYPNNVIQGNLFKAVKDGDDEDRSKWVKPLYPFNHVYESESGHVIEIDDTPDYERINVFHRSVARLEINNKGEIHIVAAEGQDMNLQAANVNIGAVGGSTLNIKALAKVIITAFKAAKIVSKGPTDIISSGETKITSLKDVIMKAVKKIKIQ